MARNLQGIILWCNYEKGYGELKTTFGERLFFLCSEIRDEKKLKSGDSVCLRSTKGTLFGKSQATDLVKVSKSKVPHRTKQKEVAL